MDHGNEYAKAAGEQGAEASWENTKSQREYPYRRFVKLLSKFQMGIYSGYPDGPFEGDDEKERKKTKAMRWQARKVKDIKRPREKELRYALKTHSGSILGSYAC